jgi:hypothetical protein
MSRAIIALIAGVVLPSSAMGQSVRAVVDCHAGRLDGAERETCASADLMRLTAELDRTTARLESTLTGRNKEALIDTEGPFRIQRNNCQNAASHVHDCIERLVRARLDALTAAATVPDSIVSEVGRYEFLTVGSFVKWGDELVGKRVRVWGCIALDPGPTPESRTHGTIRQDASPLSTRGPSVTALFTSMNDTAATWFYDAKKPCGYWHGVVERRDGGVVLAQMEPQGLN